MSIPSIYSAESARYTSTFEKPKNTCTENTRANRNTGPDTTTFSQEALHKAQGQNADSVDPEIGDLPLKDTLSSADIEQKPPSESLSGLLKKSMFSLLLENLFLTELTENAAASSEAVKNDPTQEDGVAQQQPSPSHGSNLLKDSEAVSQIKNVLTDLAKGKADMSDIVKAMAGGASAGSTGEAKGSASKQQGGASASSGKHERDNTIDAK